MERQYFDAKFEGLEKLMRSQQDNLTNHINAVSSNVKRVEGSLNEHRESTSAHGIEASNRAFDRITKWGGFAIGIIALLISVWRHH